MYKVTEFKARFQKLMRVLFAVFLTVLLLFSFKGLEASLLILRPAHCSGGWDNPERAVSLSDNGDANSARYQKETSATIKDSVGVLTCGEFVMADDSEEVLQDIPDVVEVVVNARADFGEEINNNKELSSENKIDEIDGILDEGIAKEDIGTETVDETGDDVEEDHAPGWTLNEDEPVSVDDEGNVISSPVDVEQYAGQNQQEQSVLQEGAAAEAESVIVEELPIMDEVVVENITIESSVDTLESIDNEVAESVEASEPEEQLVEEVTEELIEAEIETPAEEEIEPPAENASEPVASWWQRFRRPLVAVAEEGVIAKDEEETALISESDSGIALTEEGVAPKKISGGNSTTAGLEVFITIAKQEFLLGTIPAREIGQAFTFTAAVPEGVNWEDIHAASVSLRPVLSFDVAPVWLVDSISMQIERQAGAFEELLMGAGERYEMGEADYITAENHAEEEPGGVSVRVNIDAFLNDIGVVHSESAGPALPPVITAPATVAPPASKVAPAVDNLPITDSILGPLMPAITLPKMIQNSEPEIEIPVLQEQESEIEAAGPEPVIIPDEKKIDPVPAEIGPVKPTEDPLSVLKSFSESLVSMYEGFSPAEFKKNRMAGSSKLARIDNRHSLMVPYAQAAIAGIDPQVSAIKIIDPAGDVVSRQARVEVTDTEVLIHMPVFTRMRPGTYQVEFEIELLNRTYVFSEEVVHGVLTLNTDRSEYSIGESAWVQMAALGPEGHTLCEAPLEVVVQDPEGGIRSFSVVQGTIELSGDCGLDNITDEPDYSLSLPFNVLGTHVVWLRNAASGEYIEQRIMVSSDFIYRTHRKSATRINPFAAEYVSRFWLEGMGSVLPASTVIVEEIPKDFIVRDGNMARVEVRGSRQLLVWDTVPTDGFWYSYQAPPITPFIFNLGQIRLVTNHGDSNEILVYREKRTWQLASDAPGDLTVRREATAGDVPDSNGDRMEYDTSIVLGSDVTYAVNGLFRLNSADKYLIIYSEGYNSSGTADPSEIDVIISTDDGVLNTSRNTCYIPRTGGIDDCWASGAGIYDALAARRFQVAATKLDGGSATLARIANMGGMTLLRLSDAWEYIMLREVTGGQTVNSGSFTDITWDTQDEYDTAAFTHSTSTNAGEITLDNVAHYLVMASVGFESTTTDERAQEIRLTLDGVEIPGAYSSVFIPSDGATTSQIHSAAYMGVIETDSSDQILAVEARCSGDTCGSVDIAADYSGISIVELPAGVDYVRLSDSTDQVVDGTADTIEWDTDDELDTGHFGHSTSSNTSRIQFDHSSGTEDYLFFASFLVDRASSTDADPLSPHWEWRLDGSSLYQYGSFARYNNGANGGYTARTSGAAGGFAAVGVANTSYLELINTDESTGADADAKFQADSFAVQGISLTSLFESAPVTQQNHYRWRAVNPSETLSSTTFGAVEDTSLASPVAKEDNLRVRFGVANAGDAVESAARTYELEVGVKTTTCAAISSWTDVSTSTTFQMVDDANFTNGAATTELLDNGEGYTFVAGEGLDTSDTSGSIGALSADGYTEIEYSFEPTTSAAAGTTYCLRLYDANNTTALDEYLVYPEIEIESASDYFSFSITDTTVGFGQLSAASSRYATGDGAGSGTEVNATSVLLQTNASGGYNVDIKGSTLTNSYADTIDAIGGTSAAASVGSEQFGLRVETVNGAGTPTSPYNHASNYAYDAESVFDQILSNTAGSGNSEEYDLFFLANMSSLTASGEYTADLELRATASF